MLTFSKIVVAVDGSELTKPTTEYALRLADRAEVHFVCAIDPGQFFSTPTAAVFNAESDREIVAKAAQSVIDGCLAAAAKAGVAARGYVLDGRPTEVILNLAAQIDADLIVLASHGRGGFARAVLGSVAEGIARLSPVAVLFVPTGLAPSDPSRHLHQIFHGI